MRASQEFIVTYGCGLIVWLPQDGRGNGHAAKLMAEKFKKLGFEQGAAYVQCGFKGDARDYDAAVGIVEHFAIQSVIILSENEAKLNALRSHGVKIHASHSVG
jgi:GTP cyclohydrolase II